MASSAAEHVNPTIQGTILGHGGNEMAYHSEDATRLARERQESKYSRCVVVG